MSILLDSLEYLDLNKNERRQRISTLRIQFSEGSLSLFDLNNANNDGIITDDEYDYIID